MDMKYGIWNLRGLYRAVALSTWCLILRVEHRQRMFENRVLNRIFGPKRYEIIGCWRKLRSFMICTLHPPPPQKKKIRMIKSRKMR
jgi:hypothetical protein